MGHALFLILFLSALTIGMSGCVMRISPRIPRGFSPKLIIGPAGSGLSDVSECGRLQRTIGFIDRKSFHGFSGVGTETITCIIEKRIKDHQCKQGLVKFLDEQGVTCSRSICGGNAVFYGEDSNEVSLIFSFLIELDKNFCVSRTEAFLSYARIYHANTRR